MTFIWPWMLVTLIFIPVLIFIYFRLLHKRAGTPNNFSALGVAEDEAGRRIGRRRHVAPIFFIIGLTILLFGLSRPEMVVSLPRVEGTVILAFDVSNSMAAEDMEPTRMEAAKTAAKLFVENQPDTIQLGVVAFSNGGFVLQSPTYDQSAVLESIDRLSPQGATSLGQGIFTSLNAIAGEAIAIEPEILEEGVPQIEIGSYPSAVVLLLTDGENTSNPDPLEVAQLAANAAVRVYPVGIGSKEGTVIEVEGFNILTQLDEPALQEIASLTNGDYYFAADEESLQEVYQNVDLQLTVKGEKAEATAYFAGLSMLFFLISGMLTLLWFGRMPI